MRVVHTFVESQNVIWKELLYTQYLSAVLAKKHYGNITLVTTPQLAKMVTELGLPYDEIITGVTDNTDLKCWSIPKLKSYCHFNEPFLHIDTDVFIFNKINFGKKLNKNGSFEKQFKSPIIFAHPDLKYENKFNTNVAIEFSNLIKTSFKEDGHTNYVLGHLYSNLFMKLFNTHNSSLVRNVDFASIPNACIVYADDFNLLKEGTNLALKHYYQNKDIIDADDYGENYIEQLMIHANLTMLNTDYKTQSLDMNHILFKQAPFERINDTNPASAKINDTSFPYNFKIIDRCNYCNNSTDKLMSFKDKFDITNFFDYNFEGFLHTTFHKWYDVFQIIIIDNLRKEIGDDNLLKIYDYYKKIYPSLKLPTKSSGEILYEELTGFKFDKNKTLL